MFRLASPPRPLAAPARDRLPTPQQPAPQDKVYGREFYLTYGSNTLLMMAISLLFRYADFVTLLGGGELTLGLIVGIGTIGSFAMRLAQGVAIDRYGPRWIWLGSIALVVAMLLAHLGLSRADTPLIYLVRIVYASGVAGAFGASITYISLRAPAARLAETIGMLGSSGFLGMALGTLVGDELFRAAVIERAHLDRMFLVAALLAAIAMILAAFATQGQVRPVHRRRPPMLWLLRRYHPGMMLLMGAAMGMGLGLPGTFLRPYAQGLSIEKIGAFFGVYAVTAFAMRILFRRVPDRIGVRATVLLGMAALVASLLLYLLVTSAWMLILPGIAVGFAHALLFPAVMAGGSGAFPTRYRGLGTTLILGTFDLGGLIGMPLAGLVVEAAHRGGLPPYPTMFVTMAVLLVAASASYALTSQRRKL